MENNVKNLIWQLFQILYKSGQFGLQGVSLICSLILLFHQNKNDKLLQVPTYQSIEARESFFRIITQKSALEMHFFNNLNNNDILSIWELLLEIVKEEKKEIAKALKSLIDDSLNKTSILVTDDFSVRIMQTFAKELNPNNKHYFVDLCVGTGKLLNNLDCSRIAGFDINKDIIEIARAYLYFNNDCSNFNNVIQNKNSLYLDRAGGNATFIFDPPLNNPIELQNDILSNKIRQNFYLNSNKIPSEYLFLSKILFDAQNQNCNYVNIFLNNFLFAQDKFKASFRRYLIEHSLIAIIESKFAKNSGIQKLILVGESYHDENKKRFIYLITPKVENIPQQILDEISEKTIKQEFINEEYYFKYAKVKTLTIEELRENDYQITMPQYYEDEINPQNIDSVEDIVKHLRTSNDKIKKESQNLENFLNNLLEGVKNINLDYQYAKIKKEKNIEMVKNWFDEPFSDLNNALGIFAEEKELDWTPIDFIEKNYIDITSLDSCIFNLRLLYQAKRLRYNNGFLEIYSKENLSNYDEQELFSHYIIETNNADLFYKKISVHLSEKQVEIFNTYIKFYFDYDDEIKKNNVHLYSNFEKYSVSEMHSAVATLKTLGLLYNNPNIDDGIEKYLPYVALLNIKEVT